MKNLLVGIMLGALVLFITGCSIFDGMTQSHHEDNSTSMDVPLALDVVSAAIEKSVPKTGYSVNKTKDTILDKEFVGQDIDITAKKINDNSSKIYDRIGFSGDPVKEGAIISEIKKELNIK